MTENWNDILRISVDELCVQWTITLVHFLWQGAAIGVVVAIAGALLRGRSAAARYALHSVALLCMPICLAGTFAIVDAPRVVRDQSLAANPPGQMVHVDTFAPSKAMLQTYESAATTPLASRTDGAESVSFRSSSAKTGESNPDLVGTGFWAAASYLLLHPQAARLIATLYAAGAFLFFLRLAIAVLGGHRMRAISEAVKDPALLTIVADQSRRMGLRIVPVVAYCRKVAVPTVIGLLRPIVLLPSALTGVSSEQLAVIISHELAHIRRHDLLLNLLQRVIESLLFFHPAVWYVSRRMSAEREVCCDDVALSLGYEKLLYAGALLRMAELCASGRRGSVAALAASGRKPSQLEVRIERLLSAGKYQHLRPTRAGVSVFVLLLALVVLAPGVLRGLVHAQETKAESIETSGAAVADRGTNEAGTSSQIPVQKVTVHCVDAEGKSVAGAEVHLFQGSGGEDARYLHFGPFKSDEQGKAICAEAIFTDAIGTFDRWIYARVPGRLVGVARSARWKNRRLINGEARVELQKSRSVEGQVRAPEGFDPREVTVQVRAMHVFNGLGDWDYDSFPRQSSFPGLDTALPDIFEQRPDAEGRIRFDDVPIRGRLYVVTVGDGLGQAQWRNDDRNFDEPIALNVEREAKLLGRVLSPEGSPAVGVQVNARLSHRSDTAYYLSTFTSVTDENGEFLIDGLPQAILNVSIEDPQERWVFRPLEGVRLRSDEQEELTLQLEPGVVVTGRILSPDGKPVEGAGFSAVADSQEGSGLSHDLTDEVGRYRLHLPTGTARLYFNSLPEAFDYPEPKIVKRLVIEPGQDPIENLDFTVPRKTDGN